MLRFWIVSRAEVRVVKNFRFNVKEGEEFFADSSIVYEWFACLRLSGGGAAAA